MSSKNKTLLFVIILLTIFTFLFSIVLYWHQDKKLEEAEQTYLQTVNTTYHKILKKQNKFYETRSKANISSEGVKEAIGRKDRKALQELSKGRWKTLKSSNEFLSMMNFYLSDGTVLLRMHKPDKFDDNVAAVRPIINNAISTQKPLHGFELETDHLAYRSISPVFDENRYIGALEFTSRPDEIFSDMEYISGLKGALFIKIPAGTKSSAYTIGEYTLQYNSLGDMTLLDSLKQSNYGFDMFRHYKIGDKTYAVYSFDMSDFEGKSVGKAVFFNDITQIKNDFTNSLIEMISFLVFLLILLVIGINWGFHKIISKLDETLKESENAHNKLLNYFDLIDQNVITSTTDLQGNIITASTVFCTVSGYSREELIGQNHRIVRHPDMPASLYEEMWSTLLNDGVWHGEIKNRKKDGGYYWVMATIHPLFDDEGTKIGYTAIRHDITDKKMVEEIAITDSLTGLYNRRYFDDIFARFINTAKRNNDYLCFYMIDVDYFKPYNDTYGHQAGDNVLMMVAKTIQSSLKRSDDYCFRLGGEEFGILIRVTDKTIICDFGEQLCAMVEALKIPHSHNKVSEFVTISIGQYCDQGLNIINDAELYKNTDDLLYKAKQAGRNQVMCNSDKSEISDTV